MKLFRNISIKKKIILITMLTCMVVLIALLVSFTILEFTISRTALVEKVATLAEVIGTNSTAALTFNDPKSAEATLSALRAESEIASAAIYTKEGSMFALYLHPQKRFSNPLSETEPGAAVPGRHPQAPAKAPQTSYAFFGNHLELTQNIILEGEIIGYVYLKSSLGDIYRRLGWYIVFALSAMIPSLLIAYLLSSRLQQIISRPIMDLARTMKMVSREKNYAVQVEKWGEDELGALIDGFNEMLSQIQQRDLALEQHRDDLEMEVQRRTAELSQTNRQLEGTIAELHRTTQVLVQNEKRLAYAQQAARLGYWEWLVAPDNLICSEEAGHLFGLQTTEIGMNRQAFIDFIHPEDQPLVEDALDTALATERSFRIDCRIIPAVGFQRILNLHGEVITGEDGKPCRITGTVQDITERKEAERALIEREEKYRALMDNAGEGILLTDVEGNLLEANKKMIELLGYSLEELITMNFVQIHPSEEIQRIKATFQDSIDKGSAGLSNTWVLCKDGRKIPVDITNSLVRYAGKTLAQTIFRDISERLKMEEERLLLSKMESVGLLAGGIAHDFNNILTAILGNISLARMETVRTGKPEEFLSSRLEEAEKACERAQALASQLLSFAKGGLAIKKVTSVAGLIKESANLVLSGSKARSKLMIPPDLWLVEVDEGQISQVFNNLLINADQAMPEGGTIAVQAENVMVGDELPLSQGRYVKITVADQGIGIPSHYLGKIFDPYFTTKQKGNGLGLATVHSIIRNNAGYITVESQVGVGTTFYVYLPAVERGVAPDQETPAALIQGQGRILLMDDEEMVRNVLGRMLQNLGYEVHEAVNGEDAIKKYAIAQQGNQAYTAVIFDLTVPGGMGGMEALRQILVSDPQVKAIVSSGYSDDPIMANYREYGFKGVITKPYRITKLSEVLHEVIMK